MNPRHARVLDALIAWDRSAPRIKLWHVDVQLGALVDGQDLPIMRELGASFSQAVKALHPKTLLDDIVEKASQLVRELQAVPGSTVEPPEPAGQHP